MTQRFFNEVCAVKEREAPRPDASGPVVVSEMRLLPLCSKMSCGGKINSFVVQEVTYLLSIRLNQISTSFFNYDFSSEREIEESTANLFGSNTHTMISHA
jgi:hypothetical protein